MTKERIERAIKVIHYAIKNNISVKEASIKCGYASSYVKNIKAVLLEKYEANTIDDELFELFMNEYNSYEKNFHGQITNYKELLTQNSDDSEDDDMGGESEREEITKTSVNKQLKQTVKGNDSEITYTDSLDSNYPENHIKTLDDLLKACEVNKKIWQVKDYLINKWDVTSWKNGDAQTVQNYQVKAKLEKMPELQKSEMAAKIFRDMVENYKPPVFNIDDLKNNRDFSDIEDENNLFEVSIFDLHLGKLGWIGETGENFDSKIASQRFKYSIKKLIYRSLGYSVKRILFPIGNDFFNSDNKQNTTSYGTPQDEDLRWQKTFDVGCKLLVDGINMLKQLNVPIDVIVIPGNHDFERSYYAGKFLEAWFNNDSQVNINNNASPRKYYIHGEVLLGFTHGKDERQDSLPLLMATDKESKPYWSDTTYHEWHVGHIHRKREVKYTVLDKNKIIDENLGVTVRYLSSLTGTEEWHHRKGFVGQIKAAEGFIWNDKYGLVSQLNSNLPEHM